MKFPVAVLDIEDYLKKLQQLLHGNDCVVFIDTNAFALYYSLYPNARAELAGWLKPLADRGRLKIPVWVLHEYTNRFIRDQTHDYFSPIKRINTLQKEFIEIKAFLRKNTDISETDFLQDLDLVEEKLKGIYNATKKKNGDHERINEELEDLMKDCVLKSDIDKIIQRAGSCGQGRYLHKMPPGFEDRSKGLNEFGDLIIWYEILDYCRENDLQKVIFLSNDNKKDWVYAPRKIKSDNGKTLPNRELFKIADPRLVHEFYLATGSEEFYMINFETLTRAMINYDSNLYYNLATALQLSFTQTEEYAVIDIEPEDDNEPFLEDDQPYIFDEANFDYPDPLVTLGTFTTEDVASTIANDSVLLDILRMLRSHKWQLQNEGIEKLDALDLNTFPETKGNRSKLYFLGLAIYDSACNGGVGARDFIESLQYKISLFNDFVATHLIAGMLYEIYFDDDTEFRQYELKSAFALELLRFQEDPKVRYAIEFISDLLKPYQEKLLVLPSRNPRKIKVTIHHEGASIGEDDIIDGVVYPRFEKITNVIAGTKRLVHENLTNFAVVPLSGTAEIIEGKIASFFAVPPAQLQIEYVRKKNYYERQANTFRLNEGLTLGMTPKPVEAWLKPR